MSRFRPLNATTKVGLVALAIASLATNAARHLSYSDRLTDPILGFLYGIAIGATLLGIWRQGRQHTRLELLHAHSRLAEQPCTRSPTTSFTASACSGRAPGSPSSRY